MLILPGTVRSFPALRGEGRWSFDLALQCYSSSIAKADDTLRAPAYAIVDIGTRHRFGIGDVQLTLRPQLRNLFNSYGWNVSSSGGFAHDRWRTFLIEPVADFY